MQIECVLKRDGGTQVTLGAARYHFQPQADGAHVATVDDDAHIERFLALPEGYRIYRGAKAKQADLQPQAEAVVAHPPTPTPAAPPAEQSAKRKRAAKE